MTPDSPFQFSRYTPRDLEIIDTTLREGSQTSLLHDHYKYFFSQTDKVEIAQALIIYGVKFIELFAPIVSPQELDDLTAIQAVRDELITQKGYTFLLAHVRCHPDDVRSAIEAGFDGLNFYIGTSDPARIDGHGKNLDEIIHRARSLIEQVRRDYPHLILRFSGEDAFRTREADLFRVYDEIAPLVHRLGTPDTVGMAPSLSLGERFAIAEPVHGAAPDIAGQGIANPIGAILSSALLARYGWNASNVAGTIEAAVENVLASDIRTPDLASAGGPTVGTEEMGRAILAQLG
jgi:homocitrate synthase